MKKLFVLTFIFSLISLTAQSQTWTPGTGLLYTNPTTTKVGIGTATPTSTLQVAGNFLVDDPNDAYDWNNMWQSGFFQSTDATNAPETSGWFWGINMGHSSNNVNYRYNGQIAIKNYSTLPTMYFRSTTVDGTGVWAKVLHNYGDQSINGNLGLGITTPSARLEVYSGDIRLRASSDDAGDIIFNKSDLSQLGRIWTRNDGSSRLYLSSSDNTSDITINETGLVGIGTTSPLANLQINSIRPILFNYCGGNGIYGSYIGFNALINTGVAPNRFIKLGNTSQMGAAAIITDHWGNMFFQMYDANTMDESTINYQPNVTFANTGNVGIGCTNPGAKLTVNGNIKATQIDITTTVPCSDYVFEKDYNLMPLAEVESFVNENKHLPEVPSAAEFKENGYSVGQMDDLLLRKVEELTLYTIEQQKLIEEQQKLFEAQQKQTKTLLEAVDKQQQEIEGLKKQNEILLESIQTLELDK